MCSDVTRTAVLGLLVLLLYQHACIEFVNESDLVLQPPLNVSVRDISSTGGRVQWQLVKQPAASGVEITINQLEAQTPGEGLKNFVIQVDIALEEYTVQWLRESTTYVLYLTTYKLGMHSEPSERIYFTTTEGDTTVTTTLHVTPLDALIVFSLVTAWTMSIGLFVHKWSKIRICRSAISRVKPKNLETVKVVKKSTESIIRRSHSTHYNKTLAAREKRIARMRTMPEIKLDFLPPDGQSKSNAKDSKPAGKRQRSMSLPYFDKPVLKPLKIFEFPLMKVSEEEETEVDKPETVEEEMSEAEECLLKPGFV